MNWNKDFCPYCNSNNIEKGGAQTTLVGWFGSDDENPNHHSCSIDCLDCNQKSIKHWVIKDKNYWYVNTESHCLFGKPSCCATIYKLKCDCGSWMLHSCYDKYQEFTSIAGKCIPNQPMYWECDSCKTRKKDENYPEFSSLEEINSYIQEHKNDPEPEPKRIGFVVFEEMGTSYYNSLAAKLLK